MNILLISPYFKPMVGGVETHLDDLCNFFNKKHIVWVRTYKALGTKNRGQTNERLGSINIHRLWWPNFNLIFKLESYPILKFFYLFLGLFLDCLIFLLKNSKKINVIQAHGFVAAAIAVPLAKLFNKRVVVNTHVGFNLSGGLMTSVIKKVLINADKVLVLTTGIKRSLVDIGVKEEKIEIYHYWVDHNTFNRVKDAKRKLGWQNKFVVLFVGRLIEVKGVNTIFKLAKEIKGITFAIAGSGPLANELEERAKEHQNVLFLGKVNNKDLSLYYSGADVLLILSKVVKQEYEEGIPRVMIEALFCGLPVVSTKTGGIPDVFSDEIGQLTDDKLQSITKVMETLYKSPTLLKKFSIKCRPYALRHFGIDNAEIILRSLKS